MTHPSYDSPINSPNPDRMPHPNRCMTHPSYDPPVQIHDKMAISVGNVTIKLQNPGISYKMTST